MAENKPVRGEEALRRMASRALGQSGGSLKGSEEEKDPLEEVQKFTKQMAAQSIIESEVEKSKASAEKAKAEAEEAKARARRAESGEGGEKVKPPIEVSGSVKLGDIDYGKMLLDSQKERDELRRQAEEQARTQAGVNEELRRELHEKEMQVLKISLEAQMQTLTKMIESNASKGSFMDQYNIAKEMATQLGYVAPSGAATDLKTQVELKKLEFEQARELKRLAKEDRAEERRWQMELRRLDDEREARKEEAARQAKKDEMFAKAPEILGGALAQGIMARGGEVGGSGAPAKPKGKGAHHVEAGVGEAGEINCPSCGEQVGIGPTAKRVVCANCGETFPIRRSKAEAPAEEE